MSEPISLLLSKLEGVRRTAPGSWMARCPCHQDRSPSLSIREASDGRVLIYCFGGCGATDVVLSLGLDLADLFPPRQEATYAVPRARDRNNIPRVPAADALRLLDQESFYVWLVAAYLKEGKPIEPYWDLLSQSAARIQEIRQLWEMQP